MTIFSRYLSFLLPISGLVLTLQALIYFGILVGYSQNYESLTAYEKLILIAGLVGFFAFWLGMLGHYFSNKELKHRVIWGFSLVFLSWLSSLIYFFTYFMRDFLSVIKANQR